MCRNKILEKLLAIILIFTLTFANFAFVTESFASSFVETLFGEKPDTGHKNVEFEAYFGTEEEKETSVISDVNNEELSIALKVNIQEQGYLKDAKIEIAENEEGKGLNFKLKDNLELPDVVQSLEDNTIYLKQVDKLSDAIFNLPIEYKNEEYVNDENFSKNAKVIFSGIYVDEKGKEIDVSREITLQISWQDDREIDVESNITKYIDFGKGVILQTAVRVNNIAEGNSLPVKNTKLEIKVPKFEEKVPTQITIVANTTEGTNGKTAGNVIFDKNNWYYDNENQILTISVDNKKELVIINENPEEYLKEENEEILEEERYFNKQGIDEFLITYTFDDISLKENTNLSSEIKATVTRFSGIEKNGFISVVESAKESQYNLEGQTGDIVSLNIENETKEVSKSYMYVNHNHNSKYEIEYKSKTILNISYKDIIEEIFIEDVDNAYINKDGSRISTEDMYYKQLTISKENFNQILGEEGEIKILDIQGNELATINKDYTTDEFGNFVVNIIDRYTKLTIKTSAPINEGNLIIGKTRAVANSSLDKQTLQSISSIVNMEKIKAKYTYVEEYVEIQNIESTTNLLDTVTKANLVIDRDSLSTLATNTDVELRIELNNDKELSDIYGHSVFEIQLPDYIQSIEVTNANIVYGEGLQITSVEVFDKIIRVTIDGVQEGINTGVLTNGTNIELNANIKVDLYTPAKSEFIKLNYTNNEATNYDNNGYAEVEIGYSAPVGLVTVNSTANYNQLGSVLTSVRQGTQEDLIDIYSEAKAATMEIIVMNNNNNKVSDVSILGRIPFKGVKDIATGEDLGTTLDTKLLSGIVSDEHNSIGFTTYYSTNGEATNDLNEPTNGWVSNPETLENIKSYLIIPNDVNYEMQEAEILRFTYQYEIPGNLPHNEGIYGTFLAYYTNLSEVATTEEVSTPDKIGLTTGEGPELSIGIETDRELVKEYEEVKVKVAVTNIGEDTAKDIMVTVPIPEYTTYETVISEESLVSELIDGKLIIKSNELEKNKNIEFTVILNATKLPTLTQYYKNTEGFMQLEDGSYVIRRYNKTQEEIDSMTEDSNEEITYEDEVITGIPEINIEVKASVVAKDLGTELFSESKQVSLKEAEFSLKEYSSDQAFITGTQDIGTEIDLRIDAKNLTTKDKTNVTVTQVIPEGFSFVSAFTYGNDKNKIENATYDEATRTISWKIDKIEAKKVASLSYVIKVESLPEGAIEHTANFVSEIKAEGTDTYISNTLPLQIGKALLTISQTTTTTDTYIKEGNTISYVFTVKNEGSVRAKQVSLVDEIPEGLIVRNISYISDGILTKKQVSTNDKAIVNLNILPHSEAVITIEALAGSLNGVQERTVTNAATISAKNALEQTTNSITHIIEADEKSLVNDLEESTTSSSSGGNTNQNIVKTYKVTGTAWLDSNRNGMRDINEELLSGISAKLIDSETGIITKNITTDSNGTYTFTGVKNGKYLVIFDYDTVKYTVTTYQKGDVAPNVNSDAITTQIEQGGKLRNGAVTDIINVSDGSISNIDIGLVLADTFDLKLEKAISKVTVQTKAGTTKEVYDNVTLAKTDITAKHVVGATVYVEYTMTVSNVGDIAGYAKKIVDYLPEGMTFNSGLEINSNWYTGTDGNLYTTSLADIELVSGQTKQLKLVLTKQMTEDNTGIVNNLAEIYEDYNIYGISDKNSTPANKAQGENDLGKADTIILIKTGEVFLYVSVVITSMLLGCIVAFIVYNKIVIRKRKGGV